VQAKLDTNQQTAARNTRHEYLLRALVSCGVCRLSCTLRRTQAGYRYYLCRGRTDALRVAQGQRCSARYLPAEQLDELVWADLCALLTDPTQISHALQRARGGRGCPRSSNPRRRPSVRPWPAGAPAAAAAGRLPGRGRRAGRTGAQAPRAGPPPRHAGHPAASAGRRRRAAAGAGCRRRWDQGVLPDRPRRAHNGDVRAAATAGGAAHRPRGRHRRRGRDPLRAAHLTRRPPSTLLSVAERPSRPPTAAHPARPTRPRARRWGPGSR
jgi:hypothetical protein